MTLTHPRPVPDAVSEEQKRLEVELLTGEPVLVESQLREADKALLLAGRGISADRWRAIGALPLRQSENKLIVAVPTNWKPQQRKDLCAELGRAGFDAEFMLSLACNLYAILNEVNFDPTAVNPNPGQLQFTTTANTTRSLTQGLKITSPSSIDLIDESNIKDLEDSTEVSIAEASPIVSLVDRILIEALTSGASDIHVEPQENSLNIRFRLDGVLQKSFEDLPRSLTPAVTSRLKIMAELDIAERRLPQDGRIRRMFRGQKMDFRVSTLPSRNGEKICLRLLDSGTTQLGLESLITDAETRKSIRDLGSKPYGMILVTGPTGSGKSTTLYALLAERNEPGINISTVEDPIE